MKLISGFAKQLLFTANSEFVSKLYENETMTILNFHDKRKPGRPHIQLKLDALLAVIGVLPMVKVSHLM